MGELSIDEIEAVTDIKAALYLMAEKLRIGHEISNDIRSTYDTIAGNTEFLKKYVNQIEKLKENISVAASELVSEEIAQLGAAYEIMQDDYNKKMQRIQKLVYISLTANSILFIASLASLFFRHR